ncbi:MAG: hypothetical protein JSV64_00685 [Candidatus Bathyarchaeota archaeon]|jgi:hypothetical protein|nr:MAG: hypothetical protein JSV64_00685 [Candidatus Bathyarchaeota archaeon]
MTPVRRLEGITYWVIEDSEGIHDFINTEVRKEWEADAEFENRKPSKDLWLKTLSNRKWNLRITSMNQIKLNPRIMNYLDNERGYSFKEELAKRSVELTKSIREYCTVIWPMIVREDGFQLADGYCRYNALKMMNVGRAYVYTGKL